MLNHRNNFINLQKRNS